MNIKILLTLLFYNGLCAMQEQHTLLMQEVYYSDDDGDGVDQIGTYQRPAETQ